MASPRGIGFADEAEKASNFIISGEGCGKTTCDTGVSGVCEKEEMDALLQLQAYSGSIFRLY
jgi:hypothetical protein